SLRYLNRNCLCSFAFAGILAAQSHSTAPTAKTDTRADAAEKPIDTSALPSDPAKDLVPLLGKFVDVLFTIQSQGADQAPVDKLIYGGAIPSMLRQLDPHTQFFDPAQFEQLRQMEDSEQKGFGSIV